MSDQVTPELWNENNGLWLPLIEYSMKSGLSLSTIRRKIKSNSLPFRLENGRYLILFSDSATHNPMQTAPPPPRPRPAALSPQRRWFQTPPPPPKPLATEDDQTKILTEAYELALREKEARIKLLEKNNNELQERVTELQLLIRVLEEKYDVRY